MADQTIRLEFQYDGAEGAEALEKRHAALKAEVGELSAALGRGEIDWKEYQQQLKLVTQSIQEVERHQRTLDDALEEEEQQLKETAQAAEILANSRLAEEAEKEAQAIAHETAMLQHEEDQLRDLMAAQDAEMGRLAQQVTGELKLADAREQTARVTRTATAEMGRATGNMGQGFLELSRAVEDAQYGIGGVLNNIPTMIMLFGGSAGLASAVSLTAVGIKVLLPELKELWQSLASGGGPMRPLSEMGTDLDRINAALKVSNEQLDEMKKRTNLTAQEEQNYLGLVQAVALMEKRKTEEMEKQVNHKKFLELKPPGVEEEAKERAGLLGPGFAEDKGKELIDSIKEAMGPSEKEKTAAFELRLAKKAAAEGPQEGDLADANKRRVADLQRDLDRITKRRVDDARELAEKAVVGGDLDAFREIQKLMADIPDKFTKNMRLKFEQASPEALEADRDFERAQERAIKLGAARREREQTAADKEKARAQQEATEFDIAAQEVFQAKMGAKKDEAAEFDIEAAEVLKGKKEDVKAEDARREAQRKRFAEEGLTAGTAAAYAGAKARGATPDQAFEVATQRALAHLNRQIGFDQFMRPVFANRGMPEAQKNLLATQMASAGRQQANRGMIDPLVRNMNNTQKLLAIAASNEAELARINARLDQQGQLADQIGRKGQARGRNAQKRR